MNAWLRAAEWLVFALIPCGAACVRGKTVERLVALEMGSVLLILILMLLAEGFKRLPMFDLPLALALLAFAGGLVFARFLERWI
jgi:multicomponent Na+:H+ antiporter subunit F